MPTFFGWYSWRNGWAPAMQAEIITVLMVTCFGLILVKNEWMPAMIAVLVPVLMRTFFWLLLVKEWMKSSNACCDHTGLDVDLFWLLFEEEWMSASNACYDHTGFGVCLFWLFLADEWLNAINACCDCTGFDITWMQTWNKETLCWKVHSLLGSSGLYITTGGGDQQLHVVVIAAVRAHSHYTFSHHASRGLCWWRHTDVTPPACWRAANPPVLRAAIF